MNDLEADLLIANAKIKQLEQELADYHHMSELVDGKMEENKRLRQINEKLQNQLAESQRQLQAAVEELQKSDVRCRFCKNSRENSGKPCIKTIVETKGGKCFEWRGPQEAGKGEAE